MDNADRRVVVSRDMKKGERMRIAQAARAAIKTAKDLHISASKVAECFLASRQLLPVDAWERPTPALVSHFVFASRDKTKL